MENPANIVVDSPNIKYTDEYIYADYEYEETLVRKSGDDILATPFKRSLALRTARRVGRVGVMLAGWGGNNGSTFTAALLANRRSLTWDDKDGTHKADWLGSITQAAVVRLGLDETGADVHVPLGRLLPMLNPDDVVVDGWDISSADLGTATARAKVLPLELQKQLAADLQAMKPRKAAFDSDFIAANQADRADNVLSGTKREQYEQLRADIRAFRAAHDLQTLLVLWTANTERFCEVTAGVHDTPEALDAALDASHPELSPSTLYALAAIDEGCTYINGSPQNTIVPGVIERARRAGVCVGGDDFKSGQTKLKSVLVEFLVQAGLKPTSIVSYNHLGNNDGKNLSAPMQFRSKEISKSNVVDDMVESNRLLYAPGEKPDHVVVIKYVPYVGDSKRAMDEYTSEILLGGRHTLVLHNTCEDSLLAAPLMLDLLVLAELLGRVNVRADSHQAWEPLHPVLSALSYLLKAPLVPPGAPVVNALSRQRAALDNLLRACLALPPTHHMHLEHKVPALMRALKAGELAAGAPPAKKARLDLVSNGDH